MKKERKRKMKEIDLKCPNEVLEKWTKVVERIAIKIIDEKLSRIENALIRIENCLDGITENISQLMEERMTLRKYLDELKEVLGFEKEEK